MYFIRRYAVNQFGTWHIMAGDLPVHSPRVGEKATCDFVLKSGTHQTRPLQYAVDTGSITVCGRCLKALLEDR